MALDSRPNLVTEDGATVARMWYVAPRPPAPRGWLVYSRDFILAAIQGRAAEPHNIIRTRGWLFLATVIQCLFAPLQAVLMLLAWLPGTSSILETIARVFSRNAVGFFLRACYWKAQLNYLGQDTVIDQYVEIWGPASVSIGSLCHIDTSVRLAAGERRLRQHGWITIGDYVHLGPGVHIAGRGGVKIGDCVGVMANAHLYSATGVIESPADPGQLIAMSHMAPHDQQHIVEAPILIDDYAFIGMTARIMPGVRVGRGAVVHANVELTSNVPPFANIGAIPRGKQIGWRKPRRISPRWMPPAPAVTPEEEIIEAAGLAAGIRIREVLDPSEAATIYQVVDLHAGAFAAGVISQLGRSFVFHYYVAMINSQGASLWVAEADGKVCGFLGCATDRHAFERSHRSGAARALALWRFITFRLNPLAVLRAFKKQRLSRHFEDRAELLSIVVSPEFRRAGLGKRFLNVWTQKLRAAGLPSYIVFTDNPEGIRFYEKYGGENLFKFCMRDLWSACYRFTLGETVARVDDHSGHVFSERADQ
ncbi:MAG TPA: GNAT family N-acetyltransferase [Phycisphaerae bacterium]|nr:GNAT family N-acetyltransferase [Phycisphaerae bacterium]